MPCVSVIVPVYRAQSSLADCAASILQDAPADLELILVDDGSPDDSPALCDRLAGQDPRVQVIHQANGGASTARNAGLDAAAGEYVLFVDADDRLLPGLWAAVLPLLQRQQPDLCVFGVQPARGVAEPLPQGFWTSPAQLPQAALLLEQLLIRGGALCAPYGKFYRRTLLCGLRFDPQLLVNEDFLFNVQALTRCGPILFVPDPFYRYENTQQGSLSRRLRDDLLDAEAATRPALAKLLQALGLAEPEQHRLLHQRQLHCAVCQFQLLAGQKGRLPFARRQALTRQILAVPGARAALTAQYRADPNRLLALPYRIGLALGSPGLLAAYCALKNRFL